jgi:hypothetical protein
LRGISVSKKKLITDLGGSRVPIDFPDNFDALLRVELDGQLWTSEVLGGKEEHKVSPGVPSMSLVLLASC